MHDISSRNEREKEGKRCNRRTEAQVRKLVGKIICYSLSALTIMYRADKTHQTEEQVMTMMLGMEYVKLHVTAVPMLRLERETWLDFMPAVAQKLGKN